jgi:2-C-methyl-D-erythritol 4-phosphate cytidylyltransferase
MNIAIIIAGGVGQRMGQDIPKQFLSVNDKPIIIYTLEAFEKHPNIDKIAVVCLDGWQEVLRAYSKQFGISKLSIICSGGKTGQESIYKGLQAIKPIAQPDDVILVHDAIRPMVSQDIITDCIVKCKKYGNAISVIPCNEAMMKNCTPFSANVSVPRDNLKRTQTPQAMLFKNFIALHEAAIKKGITSSIATCALIIEMGGTVYYSLGSEKNIKLTTIDDLDIFKALLQAKQSTNIRR